MEGTYPVSCPGSVGLTRNVVASGIKQDGRLGYHIQLLKDVLRPDNKRLIFGADERKIEELYSQIKRWTWRGKPTRKARKLKELMTKRDFQC